MVRHIGNNSLKINIRITENISNKDKNNLILCKNEEEQKLHPYFITGFSNGESTFSVRIRKSKTSKYGLNYWVKYVVTHTQHIWDWIVLNRILYTFGCGLVG